jgi:hypothetical protein
MKYLGVPSSGSIAGTTSSHNRAGQYTRNRRSPVQPVGTGRRSFIRGAFGSASAAWAALSGADQAAWISYADGHPYVDRLGQAIKLTGQQMYVAIGTQLLNCGQALPTAVPSDSSVFSPVVTVFTATSAGVITITRSGVGGASDFCLVSFAKPVSAGVTFQKTFWQQTVEAGNGTGAATYGTAYVAHFGTLTAGTKVFAQLTPVNQYGVTGVPVVVTAVVS